MADEDTQGIAAFRFSGYGTLSYSGDNDRDLAPIRDFSQRPKDSYASGPTWLLDSRVGMQLAYRFSPTIEGVFQGVMRDQITKSLDSSVELAYLNYQLHANTKARVGRIGYDAFLMSDHRNLGYAYPWVRPAREFYSWIPLFSLDGADLTHDIFQGEARWRIRAQFGRSGFDIPMGDKAFAFKTDDLWSVSAAYQTGVWRFKGGLSSFRSADEAGPLHELHDGLMQLAGLNLAGISAEAASLRLETSFKDTRIRYATLGAAYDDGDWLGQTEFGYSHSTTAIASSNYTGYVAVGRRLGHFTPFAMLSASRPGKPLLEPVTRWSSLNQGDFQDTVYRTVNSTRQDQTTLSLGMRWDFESGAALKLQWDRDYIRPQGYVLWFSDMDIRKRYRSVDMLTASLDFIF